MSVRCPLLSPFLIFIIGCAPSQARQGIPSGVRLLAVPHIRQEHLLCVPTSAAMVLAFYGDPQTPRRLKAMAEGRIYDDAGFSDFSETTYAHLLRATARLDYRWEQVEFANTAEGFQAGLQRVRADLAQGRPSLIDLSLPQGHTVVAVGLDEPGRMLVIEDPDAPAPGLRTLPFAWLAQTWNESASGGPYRAMVATRPHTA